MPRLRPAVLVTAMLTLLAAACASTPEEDPVQQKLNDLDARETRVERESQSMVAMSQQVEELQAQAAPAARPDRGARASERRNAQGAA